MKRHNRQQTKLVLARNIKIEQKNRISYLVKNYYATSAEGTINMLTGVLLILNKYNNKKQRKKNKSEIKSNNK